MTKYNYIQPSVNVTEIRMVQTLCVSPGGGSGSNTYYNPDSGYTTDTQL